MKCIEKGELISLYIDDMLDEYAKKMMDQHLLGCEDCRREYEDLLSTIELCKDLPMVDLPDEFEEDMHVALLKIRIQEEENKKKKKKNTNLLTLHKRFRKINWKIYGSIAAVFVILVLSFSNMSVYKMKSISNQEMSMDQSETSEKNVLQFDETVNMAPESMGVGSNVKAGVGSQYGLTAQSASKSVESDSLDGRKVIKNANISLDIEDYDKKFNEVIGMVNSIGGYIDHSNTQYKYYVSEKPEESLKTGNITVRVPEDQFVNMINVVKNLGTVTNFTMSGQDITNQYRDTENEVENLKIQEKQLRQIMDKTKDVKEILEVERELTRVRGQINSLTGNIRRWDNLVSLSTIDISLNEIVPKDNKIKLVSDNVWVKAKKGFIQTVNSMIDVLEILFVWIISIFPIIILLLFVGIPIMWFIKKIKKR